MRKIGGMDVGNASLPVRITVTEEDIKSGRRKNPDACAVALAAVRRVKGVTAAKAHLGCIYLLVNGKWRRWMTPAALRTEIIVFDRGGRFVPQVFDLHPPPVARLVSRARRLNGHAPRPKRSRWKRHKPTHTADVRHTAHRNDGEPSED
jgi:hypothetical protein